MGVIYAGAGRRASRCGWRRVRGCAGCLRGRLLRAGRKRERVPLAKGLDQRSHLLCALPGLTPGAGCRHTLGPMPGLLRTTTTLLGAGFALQGVAWLVVPARAAAGLGMAVLDGIGRSTQFGDFAAFFLTAGLAMLVGVRPGRGRLLYALAGLFACAAFGRTVAWAFHGAGLAATFIAVEVATSVLLVVVARQDGVEA